MSDDTATLNQRYDDGASIATTAFDWDGNLSPVRSARGNGTGGIAGNPTRQLGERSTVRHYNLGASGRGGTGNLRFSSRGVPRDRRESVGASSLETMEPTGAAYDDVATIHEDKAEPKESSSLAQKIMNKLTNNKA